MIQTISIPKLQEFCGVLARCFPKAEIAIAGGAVRDLLHNKPVKDIDCFIYLDPVKAQSRPLDELITTWHDDEDLYAMWFDGCEALGTHLYCSYEMDGDPMDLFNGKGYSYAAFSLVDYPKGPHMHPVQLIFINEPPLDNVRDHFDFGLSQCWVTQAGLGMTPAYWRDVELHRITYLRSRVEPNEQRRKSSKERAERLKAKYPGWKFDRLWQLDWEPEPKMELPKSVSVSVPGIADAHLITTDNGRAFIHKYAK